jgi:WD40 repeat protein
MSDIKISSTGWLAVSLSNRAIGLFDLNDISSWQYIPVESIVNETQDDEENAINFNRNLIGFSPDGEFLVVNGQNKQVCVYSRCDFEKTEVWWKLQRMVIVKKSISALDLTNEFLFIADIIGDVYKVNLSSENDHENLIITTENCIMTNVSMILDIALISVNDKLSFILTVDQDNKICLNSYPNISLNKKYCLGHTEFVSRIKMIDNNHILAASRDGLCLFIFNLKP